MNQYLEKAVLLIAAQNSGALDNVKYYLTHHAFSITDDGEPCLIQNLTSMQ